MAVINQLGKNNPPPRVAYVEITLASMQDPRLAALNNLFLQIAQTVNSLAGYNGTVMLNAGEQLNGDLNMAGNDITNVNSVTPSTVPVVTGSKGGNAALASLITALAGLGLLTDKTS